MTHARAALAGFRRRQAPLCAAHDPRNRNHYAVHRANVLMLVENLSVPRDRRSWQEALTLRKAGFSVHVICPVGRDQERARYEMREGVAIHRFPAIEASRGIIGYGREYAAAFWRIARLANRLDRSEAFDVVHAANPPDILLLAAFPLKLRGASFVFDHHDLAPELYQSRFSSASRVVYVVLRLLEWISFRLADVVLATNESYRSIALTRGSKRPETVFVVRNSPPESFLQAAVPQPEFKHGRRYLIAYVGVMAPQDGVDHALRALALLRSRRDDWFAVFAGDGDAVSGLRRLTSELGLDDCVAFTGLLSAEEVREVLATADVCVAPEPPSPLNNKSTMIKIVEYMAAGKAIVSYDLPESHFSAAEAAAYACPNDEASLADCLDELLSSPDRRQRMGAIGRERVRGDLSWRESERELLRAYDRLLAERPPRGRPEASAEAAAADRP